MSKAPYKVDAYDVGAARVIDRATGEEVGYVLANFVGWSAYLSSAPGERLMFAPEECSDPVYARTLNAPIYASKLRRHAIQKVWTAATRRGGGSR